MIRQPSVMKSSAIARKNVHASPLASRPAKRVSGIVRFQDGPKGPGTGKKDLHAADVIHNLKNKNPLGVHTDSELAAAIDQHKSKAEVQSTDEWIRHIAVKPAPKPAKPAAHSRAEEQAEVKGASSMVDAKGNLWEYKGVCGSTASVDDFEQEIEFKMPDASELAPAEQDCSDLPAGTVFQYPGTPCGSTVSVDEFDSELQFKEVDEQLKK